MKKVSDKFSLPFFLTLNADFPDQIALRRLVTRLSFIRVFCLIIFNTIRLKSAICAAAYRSLAGQGCQQGKEHPRIVRGFTADFANIY
ncbi:hypothetical protein XNC1_1890 [Xenorhabdus nematophila ATCC 19061]|uniref:Uncharacterized protein n=1 Tax=Xenorhabdus nematophila (strain ATCC 19061 / DSM 3370 / CCUG 14189 / LMG 1036 / NCIMB 9965 / AN6) TaxID=406817 RepID=D3VD84_XENNA|nr:hypothetical protein XNC1_1890 [Xenorhabdus nematophila ATCC 19061]